MITQTSGKLISAKQASEMLGVSRATLSKIKSSIVFYRIGRKIKFRLENVENFLNAVECLPEANQLQIEKRGDC